MTGGPVCPQFPNNLLPALSRCRCIRRLMRSPGRSEGPKLPVDRRPIRPDRIATPLPKAFPVFSRTARVAILTKASDNY
jgi:hypothetical protein